MVHENHDDFRSPEWIELKLGSNQAFNRASVLAWLSSWLVGAGLILGFLALAVASQGRYRTCVILVMVGVILLAGGGVSLQHMRKFNRQGLDLQTRSMEARTAYHKAKGE